jgi:hypothetical protein
VVNDTGNLSCSWWPCRVFISSIFVLDALSLYYKCCNGSKMTPFNERKKRCFCELAVIASLSDGGGKLTKIGWMMFAWVSESRIKPIFGLHRFAIVCSVFCVLVPPQVSHRGATGKNRDDGLEFNDKQKKMPSWRGTKPSPNYANQHPNHVRSR